MLMSILNYISSLILTSAPCSTYTDLHTHLHDSAKYGHVDVLEYLLAHRADINIIDDEGHTALDIARRNSNTACVQVLEARPKSPGEPWPLKHLSRQAIKLNMVRTHKAKGYYGRMDVDDANFNKFELPQFLVNYLQYK